MGFSDEEQIEVHSDIKGKITDYDILKNVPTIDGVPVHGDITESGRYTDETPTAGSKRLITSGAMRAAMERGDLQGPKGYSPRIEVVNIGSGYRVNITDIDGTKYFDVICGENAPGTHTHDDRYYTEAEVDSIVTAAQNNGVALVNDLASQTEQKLSGKSDVNHSHDDRYCSEVQAQALVSRAAENILATAEDMISLLEEQTEEKFLDKSGINHAHDDRYYTEAEIDSIVTAAQNNSVALVNGLASRTEQKLSGKSDVNHSHDDRYCSEAQAQSIVSRASENILAAAEDMINDLETDMNTGLLGKSNVNHAHDDRYYTEAEVDSIVTAAQNNGIALVNDLASQTEQKLSGKSDVNHSHDDRYCSEAQAQSIVSRASENILATAEDMINDLETDMNTGLSGKSNTDHQHYYLRPQAGGNTVLVNSYGHLYPMVPEGQQLGTTTNRWSYILGKYVVGSAEVNGAVINATTQVNSPLFNNTSDERVKENFDTDMAKYVAMLDLLEPTSYHFKSEADMEDRKRNVGYIAQRVQDAMAEVGLDDTDFGGLCYDPERESKGEFSYGLAYSQFIPILHAKLKQLEEKYDAKIAEYDKKIAEFDYKINELLSNV